MEIDQNIAERGSIVSYFCEDIYLLAEEQYRIFAIKTHQILLSDRSYESLAKEYTNEFCISPLIQDVYKYQKPRNGLMDKRHLAHFRMMLLILALSLLEKRLSEEAALNFINDCMLDYEMKYVFQPSASVDLELSKNNVFSRMNDLFLRYFQAARGAKRLELKLIITFLRCFLSADMTQDDYKYPDPVLTNLSLELGHFSNWCLLHIDKHLANIKEIYE
jgi:hypothetical protein